MQFLCKKYPTVMIKSVNTLVTAFAMFTEFANLKIFLCKSVRPDNTSFHFSPKLKYAQNPLYNGETTRDTYTSNSWQLRQTERVD